MPIYALRQDRLPRTTDSWRQWAENREVDEWIQAMGAVIDQGWNDQYVFVVLVFFISLTLFPRAVMQRPARQYEFPTGYGAFFGPERFRVGEEFFSHMASIQNKRLN